MIFPSNRVRIVVATRPVDFRKGHDGLAAVVKRTLRRDPFTGTVFVFRAKRADRLRLVFWDPRSHRRRPPQQPRRRAPALELHQPVKLTFRVGRSQRLRKTLVR